MTGEFNLARDFVRGFQPDRKRGSGIQKVVDLVAGRGLAPQLFAGAGVETGQVATVAEEEDSVVPHAEGPTVHGKLFAVGPEDLLGSRIDGQQVAAEPPGVLRHVETFRDLVPGPAVRFPMVALHGIDLFLLA